ncbi:DsbA family oxidoreductase [Streptacidiphilus jiangxiensis]|uniref:Predicted dithiol-disulfide isomerase, DsbA family n=1 Tax=Streptacidiphilus jiangxiensis TaxID=235985 RepID=A0A1H7TQK8_STRJI|nr:DsbA family oxidoreductase [Streptacidiphilus jiangxiensis]SEL86835.1 Predicted dithiol-disulfide isomerase, DsbA family [Streptacidiphilus jiangxiensis]
MRVEIWGDINCPWCYIGKARFEKALAAFPHRDEVEVVHRSFELDPNAPHEARPVLPAIAAKYGITVEQAQQAEERIASHAHGEGLAYRGAERDVANSFDMHRLLHFAHEQGRQERLLDLLYRENFDGDVSPFAPGRLQALAVEAGLDPARAAEVLADPTAYADAVREDEATAAALGATGVPFYVFDRRLGVSGAQPPAAFASALEQAWSSRAVPQA